MNEKFIAYIWAWILIAAFWTVSVNLTHWIGKSEKYNNMIVENNIELDKLKLHCNYDKYSFCWELYDEFEKNKEFYEFNNLNSANWKHWIKTIRSSTYNDSSKLNLWPWVFMCWDSSQRHKISNQFTFVDLVKKYNSDPKLKEENKDIIDWITRLSERIDTDLKDYFDNFCTMDIINKINKFYWDLDIKVRWYEDHELEDINVLKEKQKKFEDNYFNNL